ncbi:IclR family transcriptional regulator [Roseomonas sp. E05]|uniref:IclR family transcriptional regulator n=1 Tax=Roseomonas sp. E05 TaxID=3046310 RepID=UPI0024B954B1|nr:IclR family transcriptional regulator [Roseomonas sp. E05]MDJ0389502.1 IclR family transcriptional regulator [Roseomonas sp. E05]
MSAKARSAQDDPAGTGAAVSSAAGTQTLLRGLKVLECVAAGTQDVQGIAERLGTPRSTTHRILSSLVAAKYLHHLPHKGYLLGPMPIYLGHRALEQRPLVAMAQPHCEALSRQTGDTVHLGVMDGAEVVYLLKISGTRGFEMRSRVGQRMPLATTGIGKALMLGLPEPRWRELHESALALNARSRDRPPALPWEPYAERMRAYRARGVVFDLEENEVGIRCAGAPVHDRGGRVAAAISVASAAPFMPEERLEEVAPLVRATADAVARELGWTE